MKKLIHYATKALGYLVKTMVSCLMYTLCWLCMAAVALWLWQSQPWKISRQASSEKIILTLDLNGEMLEVIPPILAHNPFGTPLNFSSGILRLYEALEDPKVVGLFVTINPNFLATFAQREEMHKALMAWRAAGKKVAVHATALVSPVAYYLASAGTRVSVEPLSFVNLIGLGADVVSLKNFLNSWGVEADFVRREDYKSGPELFTEPSISPKNREMITSVLTSLETLVVEGISAARGVKPENVSQLMDKGPFTSSQALACHLVDAVMFEDEALKIFKEQVNPKALLVSFGQYKKPLSSSMHPSECPVTVVCLEGPLTMDSEAPLRDSAICCPLWSEVFKEISKNKHVKVVVVRLNSPGGDVVASERLYRALQGVRASGKKVVISMGGYGASGGYWMALASDTIMVDAGSLTGSIGVYMGKFVVKSFLDKQGIGWDLLGSRENSHWLDLDKPFSNTTREKLEGFCDEVYDLFLQRTAEHRTLSVAAVRPHAGGRVLTGSQAYAAGLVDKIGGFKEALTHARTLAGLHPEAPCSFWQHKPSWNDIAERVMRGFLSVTHQASGLMRATKNPEGLQLQADKLAIR